MDGLGALAVIKSMRGQQQDPFEQDKFVVSKLIDLYNNAPSDAFRETARQYMGMAASGMNSKAKLALGPYMAMGPFSPQKVKEEAFRKHHGERPQITVSGTEDSNLYALQRTQQMAYDSAFGEFMTGQKYERPKAFLFDSGGTSMVAHMRDDGVLQVIPTDAEQFANQLKGHSWPEAVANNGWIDEEVGLIGSAENGYMKTRKRMNIFTGKKEIDITPMTGSGGIAGGKTPAEVPPLLVDAMVGLDGIQSEKEEYLNDKQMSLGSRLNDILAMDDPADKRGALDMFKTQHGLAGWNIIEVNTPDPGKGSFSKWWSGPNKRSFTIVPGVPIVKELPDGSKVVGYRDTSKGRDHIYSGEGMFLGMGLEEWDEAINADYARRQRSAEANQGSNETNKKSKPTVSVDEAIESNPDLLNVLMGPQM